MRDQLIIFLVVGRLGKSLTLSKLEPLVASSRVEKIFVFRETPGFAAEKTKYICLPSWILAIRPVFLSKLLRSVAEPLQLLYWSWKIKPAVINGYHIIPKGINSFIAARLSGAKCIVSMIGGPVELDTYSRFKFLLKRLNLFVLKHSDAVTTKGTVVKNYLLQHGVPGNKIFIFNGSINLDRFFFDPSIGKDIDILFVGTFRWLKGPDRVLKIIAALKDEFPAIKACFIGEGALLKESMKMADELNMGRNVQFTGYVADPSLYYQRAKILLMPSASEGLPTSMLEGMACGCVPVVSDVGNIRDAAGHGVNAFLVEEYTDIASFTQYSRTLLSNESLREKMAMAGILMVREKFNRHAQSMEFDHIFNSLFPQYVSV